VSASNQQITSDYELVKLARNGDGTAFDQLVGRHQNLIHNLLRRLGVPTQDAEDLLQETFIKAWRSLQRFNFEAAFSTWLYSIALNEWRSFRRKNNRRRLLPFPTGKGSGTDEVGPQLEPPDLAPGPAQITHDRMLMERIEKLMEDMHPALREAMVLRDIQELDYLEISRIIGSPIGTVKSRINRARSFLAKRLEKDE
jgi:RNA polymerase sigma-70 factor, ECF subfamily